MPRVMCRVVRSCRRRGTRQMPTGRLVAAHHALQRHVALVEMEQGIVAMQTTDELANLLCR